MAERFDAVVVGGGTTAWSRGLSGSGRAEGAGAAWGTHPGGEVGEVTGAPGHNAARAILADLLRDVPAGD